MPSHYGGILVRDWTCPPSGIRRHSLWRGRARTMAADEEVKLFRCSLCEREFDVMPADGMHTVHGRYPTKGGDYIDVDGECGPVYEVEP